MQPLWESNFSPQDEFLNLNKKNTVNTCTLTCTLGDFTLLRRVKFTVITLGYCLCIPSSYSSVPICTSNFPFPWGKFNLPFRLKNDGQMVSCSHTQWISCENTIITICTFFRLLHNDRRFISKSPTLLYIFLNLSDELNKQPINIPTHPYINTFQPLILKK